ncbi:MAG: UvrB/UvrC motif-containing protein [Defluviitaleaceae bacterium]|nr:UvrB/UvrC motif-containing protein [Defluviitaleaceae bacterium]
MICEKCKKNIATVYLEKSVNGQKTIHNLCHECAIAGHINIGFNHMFQSFLNSFNPNGKNLENLQNLKCTNCNMTYNDFRKTARLGCSSCYLDFSKELSGIFKNIQSNQKHSGKIPKKSGEELLKQRELEEMRKMLKKAVESEEYEEAATLRDKIKTLEAKEI